MFELLLQSFVQLMMWPTIGYLVAGVMIGMMIGILPGLGGLTGMVIILPIAFSLDPVNGIAMMMGMLAVGQTTDTIPAVLLGVPGTSAAAATVMDGYPMARQGQAARALGAAYMSSMIGGIIGAVVLLMSIPLARVAVSTMGVPEIAMLAITGLVFVASLSRGSPVKGLIAAALGMLIATVGREAQTGRPRYDFGQIPLLEGIDIAPVVLGLFALPELIGLIAAQDAFLRRERYKDSIKLQLVGMGDAIRNWFLVLRSSAIGVWIGFVPGVGASVADWVAYGTARQTVKNEKFGTGDVRGVIAPESANNAVKGGELIPTIAFGIPGSAAMAVLLAAMMNVGISPGITMLTTRLDITMTMVATLVLANVLATAVCLALTSQLVKVIYVRHFFIIAFVVPLLITATLSMNSRIFDVYLMIGFGVLGYFMKLFGWPRPPLLIGFVLAPIIERNLIMANTFYGWTWVTRPLTLALAALALIILVRSVWLYGAKSNSDKPEQPKVPDVVEVRS